MFKHSDLLELIKSPEGSLLERKGERVNAREIRQTLVAFANTVAEGEEAVLFIGVRDDGSIDGCANADKVQKDVREACDIRSYPAITFRTEVLHEHKNVVAVIIPHSLNRPHFSGPAYVRRGSESVAASAQVFEELIYSRTSKVATLLKFRNDHTRIQIIGLGHRLGDVKLTTNRQYREAIECKVIDCNPQFARFQKLASSEMFSEPLDLITITYDEAKWCPALIVKGY